MALIKIPVYMHGQIIGTVRTTRDISERKTAEEHLS
jgi:hypothetical protein